MYVSRNQEVDEYVLTFVNGQDFEEIQLGAITDRETPAHYISEDIPVNKREYILNTIQHSKYLREEHAEEDFETYIGEIRRNRETMPQEILERLGENAREELSPQDLEEDSHDPVDVEKKMDMLDQATPVKEGSAVPEVNFNYDR